MSQFRGGGGSPGICLNPRFWENPLGPGKLLGTGEKKAGKGSVGVWKMRVCRFHSKKLSSRKRTKKNLVTFLPDPALTWMAPMLLHHIIFPKLYFKMLNLNGDWHDFPQINFLHKRLVETWQLSHIHTTFSAARQYIIRILCWWLKISS